MPSQPDFSIVPSGPFSLEEAATFGFGQRDAEAYQGVMRLAFCVDGYGEQVGVEVRQDDAGVHCWVQGEADPVAVQAQVARVLSLDHDGADFLAAGQRDPVLGRLQRVAPGLRPPLFYSPYEAAAWSVLSARRPAAQMAAVRQRLSETHGRVFEVAGRQMAAFPTPERLAGLEQIEGLPEVKVRRLRGVAVAAMEGLLNADALRGMPLAEASAQLQRIDGIGPFYSSLVMIRATGLADLLPGEEPRFLGHVAQLYGLSRPPGREQLEAIAEPWRPLRTWAAVLIRAAAHRL